MANVNVGILSQTSPTATISSQKYRIGFKYNKDGNPTALVQRSNITEMKWTFLNNYLTNWNCAAQREVIFLDEMNIFEEKYDTVLER